MTELDILQSMLKEPLKSSVATAKSVGDAFAILRTKHEFSLQQIKVFRDQIKQEMSSLDNGKGPGNA